MLSVVITAWNEAENLPRAVSSVKSIAGEIVVIDTQSTDNTSEVARKLGCRVFKHEYTGIVEPVRNFSISKAKGDWILLLDADEEIPARLRDEISDILKSPRADYYRIARKNIIFNKWIKSRHWWPDYVYRLFKKDSVTWDAAIHSIPLTQGVGADLPPDPDVAIIHYHYNSISQYVERLNRYTDHQLEVVQARGHNFSWTDIVDKPIAEFLTQYFAREGYTQGFHGLAISGLQAFSELVLYLKLWQQSEFISHALTPDQFESEFTQKLGEWKWWKYESKIQRSHRLIRPFWKLVRRLQI